MNQPESRLAQISDEELVKMSLADQEQFLHIVDRYKKKLLSKLLRLAKVWLGLLNVFSLRVVQKRVQTNYVVEQKITE